MTPRTVLAVLLAVAVIVPVAAFLLKTGQDSRLPTFRDYDDLARFLDRVQSSSGDLGRVQFGGWDTLAGGTLAGGAVEAGSGFSQTNVQVQGVDELDTLKTDGTYLYLASWDRLTIVAALPPDGMRVVVEISAREAFGSGEGDYASLAGLFVDGDRLVVVGTTYTPGVITDVRIGEVGLWWPVEGHTVVAVYDIAVPSSPSRVATYGVSGSLLASRFVDGYAYVVANDFVEQVNETYLLPSVCEGDNCAVVDAGSIRYDPESSEVGAFTNILAVDVRGEGYEMLSVLTGFTSTLYMSPTALYITLLKWEGSIDLARESSPELTTTIYKVRAEGLSLAVLARGDVSGMLLNQFSMDEHAGYLRVATTTGWVEPSNGVYVLDGTLTVIGSLEGLAPTERIFAVRFLGDVLYLVTFRQIDPLFVIDLSDPRNPSKVGEIEVPGFSTYLHPIGVGHVLGVGQEDNRLKLSLYDVSDPARPREVDKFLVEGYAWSPALYDHKAVLADPASGLFVIPVDSWIWRQEDGTTSSAPGAYVFSVTAASGVVLRGVVEHETLVSRSAYIGDVLYTVSDRLVKANALADLAPLGALPYGA